LFFKNYLVFEVVAVKNECFARVKFGHREPLRKMSDSERFSVVLQKTPWHSAAKKVE
jgi:hypothetical protein